MRASPNILSNHRIKSMVCVWGYHDFICITFQNTLQDIFPNEMSFSLLYACNVLSFAGMGTRPSSSLQRGRQRVWPSLFCTNPLYERDSSYRRIQLWSPTEEDKKTLKPRRQPPFSFTSFFVSWLIPRLTAQKICNVTGWGQRGCAGQHAADVKGRFNTFAF